MKAHDSFPNPIHSLYIIYDNINNKAPRMFLPAELWADSDGGDGECDSAALALISSWPDFPDIKDAARNQKWCNGKENLLQQNIAKFTA